jgi:class 3 adenylate cyclase
MRDAGGPDDDDRRDRDAAYRDHVAELMARRVAVGAVLVALVAVADAAMTLARGGAGARELAPRLGLAVLAAAVALAARAPAARRHAAALAAVLAIALGADLASAVVDSGGAASPYFDAGAVVLLGLGLVLPVDGRRMAGLAAALWAILLVPVATLGPPGQWDHAATELFVLAAATAVAIVGAHQVASLRRREHDAARALADEQARAERLLLNILPRDIAERLKRDQRSLADGFADVTILFADIVGFTQLSARTAPEDIVGLLNQVFTRFDELAERHGLEKIKTIGDAYMVAGGLPRPCDGHAEAVAEMALDMRDAIADLTAPDGGPLQVRIGINTGPVVAGVIGTKKFIYDLWGDAVNTASRMESHGRPGAIQVTEATFLRLRDRYVLEERGPIEVKGKGTIPTWFLTGRKP